MPQPHGQEDYAHISEGHGAAAVRGVVWSTVNTAVPTVAASLVFIVSSRYLTPKDFGLVALAGSIGAFVSAIAPGAFGEALIQRSRITKAHLDTVFWLMTGSALLLYAALALSAGSIAAYIGHPELALLIVVLGLRVIFDLSAGVPHALITRAMEFRLIAVRTLIATVAASTLCLVLIALDYGLWALALSQLSVSAVSCVATFWNAKWKPGFEIRFWALRDLARYGVYATGNRFLQLMSLDQVLIGALTGATVLGIYNFAKRLHSMISDVIAGAIYSVSHTLFASLQDQRERVRNAFLLATFGSAAVSFPAFMGLMAVAGEAIPALFGDQWQPAVIPVRWFCALGFLTCIGAIQASLVSSQNKTDWWFYYSALQQISSLGVIVLAYPMGATAIVAALTVKTAVFWPVSIALTCRILGIRPFEYLRQFAAPLAASLAMLLIITLARSHLGWTPPLIRLLALVALGGTTYALFFAALSAQKIRDSAKLLLRKRNS